VIQSSPATVMRGGSSVASSPVFRSAVQGRTVPRHDVINRLRDAEWLLEGLPDFPREAIALTK
jgi:hypothetical protein